MAKFCRKCGKKLEECTCKKSDFNITPILMFIGTILLIAFIIYLGILTFLAKKIPIDEDILQSSSGLINNQDVNQNEKEPTNNQEKELENNKIPSGVDGPPETKVICTGFDGRMDTEIDFFYISKDLIQVILKHTIPANEDIDEWYLNEEIMNDGRYEMHLQGNTIIQSLDPSMYFWESYAYKDKTIQGIMDMYTEFGYTCEKF